MASSDDGSYRMFDLSLWSEVSRTTPV